MSQTAVAVVPSIDTSKVGMSDLATIVDLNPFQRPIDLWQRIKFGVQSEPTLLMDLGHHMEPFLIRRWELQTGGHSKGPRPLSLKHPFLRANLDADAELNGAGVVVDAKNSGHRMAGHWGDGEDAIPEWMVPQMQGYLWATGYERCDVVAMLGGSELRIYTVRPDKELQEMLIDAACRFWRDYVQGDKPPPADGSTSYSDFLSKRFPRSHANMLSSTTEIDLLASCYKAAKENVDRYEADMDEAKNRLKVLIGDSEGIQGNGYKITWRSARDSSITDWEGLARSLGADASKIAEFTSTRPGPRRFLLSTTKGK